MDGLVQQFQQHEYEAWQEKMALERITQMIIESIIDVGNMMIDGFIMRDPGSYEDIIDILVDEKVLPQEESDQYKAVIELRKVLVRDYIEIDHHVLTKVLSDNLYPLEKFSERVREYLTNELGPVSAFKNDKE
jgi:uncharacterized protein YutE (UPF0331/DUF86 family)